MIDESARLISCNSFVECQSDIEENGKMTSIIDRFESICKELNFWKSLDNNIFEMKHFDEDMQKDLDIFYNKGEITQRLLKKISKLNLPEKILEIILKARKFGIRIISIDRKEYDILPMSQNDYESLKNRSKGMNPFAAKKISNYMSSVNNGKFLALMGGAHLVEHYPGVAGISNLIECPALEILDLNSPSVDVARRSATPSINSIVYSSAFQNFGVG